MFHSNVNYCFNSNEYRVSGTYIAFLQKLTRSSAIKNQCLQKSTMEGNFLTFYFEKKCYFCGSKTIRDTHIPRTHSNPKKICNHLF